MVNDPQEIILDLLRAIRKDGADTNRRVIELEKQHTHLSRQVTAIRHDIADIYEILTDHSEKRQSIETRIERIERHIGLADALT